MGTVLKTHKDVDVPVKTVVIAQKKQRQVSFVDQKLAPSSNPKRTPPMGAPNAAATPTHTHTHTQ
jgi:hypothetical protein